MSNNLLTFLGGAAKAYNKEEEAKRAHQERIAESYNTLRNNFKKAIAETHASAEINAWHANKKIHDQVKAVGGANTVAGQVLLMKNAGVYEEMVTAAGKGVAITPLELPASIQKPNFGDYSLEDDGSITIDKEDPASDLAKRRAVSEQRRLAIQGSEEGEKKAGGEDLVGSSDQALVSALEKIYGPSSSTSVQVINGQLVAVEQTPDGSVSAGLVNVPGLVKEDSTKISVIGQKQKDRRVLREQLNSLEDKNSPEAFQLRQSIDEITADIGSSINKETVANADLKDAFDMLSEVEQKLKDDPNNDFLIYQRDMIRYKIDQEAGKPDTEETPNSEFKDALEQRRRLMRIIPQLPEEERLSQLEDLSAVNDLIGKLAGSKDVEVSKVATMQNDRAQLFEQLSAATSTEDTSKILNNIEELTKTIQSGYVKKDSETTNLLELRESLIFQATTTDDETALSNIDYALSVVEGRIDKLSGKDATDNPWTAHTNTTTGTVIYTNVDTQEVMTVVGDLEGTETPKDALIRFQKERTSLENDIKVGVDVADSQRRLEEVQIQIDKLNSITGTTEWDPAEQSKRKLQDLDNRYLNTENALEGLQSIRRLSKASAGGVPGLLAKGFDAASTSIRGIAEALGALPAKTGDQALEEIRALDGGIDEFLDNNLAAFAGASKAAKGSFLYDIAGVMRESGRRDISNQDIQRAKSLVMGMLGSSTEEGSLIELENIIRRRQRIVARDAYTASGKTEDQKRLYGRRLVKIHFEEGEYQWNADRQDYIVRIGRDASGKSVAVTLKSLVDSGKLD